MPRNRTRATTGEFRRSRPRRISGTPSRTMRSHIPPAITNVAPPQGSTRRRPAAALHLLAGCKPLPVGAVCLLRKGQLGASRRRLVDTSPFLLPALIPGPSAGNSQDLPFGRVGMPVGEIEAHGTCVFGRLAPAAPGALLYQAPAAPRPRMPRLVGQAKAERERHREVAFP